MRVAKTKTLISFAVYTAKLICAFVFTYANCWFSHEAAHFLFAYFCEKQDHSSASSLNVIVRIQKIRKTDALYKSAYRPL